MSETEFALALMVSGGLLTAAFVTTNLSRKLGLPSLLIYLALGFFFGNGGDNDFLFDDPRLVERCAEVALGLILFKGGYEFRHELWKKPRVLAEGLGLALLGTVGTALCTAALARAFLHWSWLEALLLGAVLSSTDAAAVFGVFSDSGIVTKDHSMEVLEIESSTNDPLAYALVVGLVAGLQGHQVSVVGFLGEVLIGLTMGVLVGAAVGLLMLGLGKLVGRSGQSTELLWLAVLTFALGAAEFASANPLITAFSAGVVLSYHRSEEVEFWGPLVALSEVALFLLLGLQVFPSSLMAYLGKGVLIALFLVFVSRPIAVFVVASVFRSKPSRSLFLGWAGLRGASSIVFGLLPLIAGVSRGPEIFSVVFTVVVLSVLLQGTTLTTAARKLGMLDDSDPNPCRPSSSGERT